jgi:P-type conjugative transfer protein TrbJ
MRRRYYSEAANTTSFRNYYLGRWRLPSGRSRPRLCDLRDRRRSIRSDDVRQPAPAARTGNQATTNLAQQLAYTIQNTTGGSAGVWQSNQTLLTSLGNLINQHEGLSYSVQGLTQQFQQSYPGFDTVSIAGVQSPQATVETTLNTLNGALASAQAKNFTAEQASLQTLELKNQTAVGNLQAVQVSNEIALAQVQQVQLLRQLVMAQMNSQNVASATQVNTQVQSGLEAQAMLSAPPAFGTRTCITMLLRHLNLRETKMRNTNNRLILAFAVIGVAAVIYGGWYLYEQHTVDEQAKSAFTAPSASGVPDMYHNAPPPPQP